MFRNMKDSVKLITALDIVAAASADRNGAILDMASHKGDAVRIAVKFGDIDAGAEITVKAEYGDESDLSDAEDITDASVSVTATDDDGLAFLDLGLLSKRYLRVVIDKDGANNSVECAWYDVYMLRSVPVTQDSSIIGSARVVGV